MIRRATVDDVDEVVAIFEPSFALLDFLPSLHTHEENLAYFRRALADGEGHLLGRGFTLLAGDTLSHLYVHPDALGTGVGRALFEHVKTIRPHGFELWVFQQNGRARRFYEAHGAVAVELTDGAGNEERTPDVRYEWRPPAGRGSRGR
ncbi:MAG TPA: GNAT family N-acetyltransferase [Gaiellaceae bacterium]|nr:GNAT family N-acetyltransferase [Gaiellaceae bacterium]